MDNKIAFVSSLLKEKNSQIMQENFELNQKAIKLTQELDQLNNAYKKVQQEKIAIETEFEKELKT